MSNPPMSLPMPPQPPRRTERNTKRAVPLVATLIVAGLAAATLASCSSSKSHTSTAGAVPSSPAVTATDPTTAPATETLSPTEVPATTHTSQPTLKPSPKPAIPDNGTVSIGQDVPAGTYETLHATTDCYWEIDKHGTSTVVNSSLGKGGHLTVVLKAGEDFTTQYCGDWRQK